MVNVRGYVPDNWILISFLIFVPLVMSMVGLITNCIISKQKRQNRMGKHIDTFNENEKPLI